MKEGTISVLFGCHSQIHSIFVVLAYRKLYKRWPTLKELICIIIHDIGHYGKDYLTSYEEKKQHWILGARIAYCLFGEWGFDYLAGHCPKQSNMPKSALYKPDKYSWYIAPKWWLISNCIFEPKLVPSDTSIIDQIKEFKKRVKDSIESGEFSSTHNIYMKMHGK